MKKLILSVAAATLVTAGLTACDDNSGTGYYDTICVSPYSHLRVDYTSCQVHPQWVYYVHSGDHVPAVNSRLSSYNRSSFKRPSNATIKKNGVGTGGGKAPTVKSGKGVSVYKPKGGGGGGYKPKGGGGYKPKAPAPARIGGRK